MADLKVLINAMNDNALERVYVFTGEESGLIGEYVGELKTRFKQVIETDDIKFVNEDSQFYSLFGGGKMYLLKQTGLFNKAAEDDFINLLVKFYKQKANMIVFVESKVDGRLKQVAALGDKSLIEFKKLSEAQMNAVITGTATKLGKMITKDLARYLAELCNYDYATVMNELTKLAYAGTDKKISQELINEVVTKQIHTVIFEISSYVSMEQYDKALELYDTLLLRKESPLVILSLLFRQYRLLYQIAALKADGYSMQDIAEACEVKPFVITKNINICKFSIGKLKALVRACSHIDYMIKSGRCKDVLAVKLFILIASMTEDEICQIIQ